MRNFKCSSCGHEFTVSFGSGQSGSQLKCPQCGGVVHRNHCPSAVGTGRGNMVGKVYKGSFGKGSRGFGRGNKGACWRNIQGSNNSKGGSA
ncbi:MAG: zinc ribbon domain-containing protein [Firmicutes bacterium]|nr:zinc ribbon domain-containing protein [Bacillota bacterium]